MSNNDIDITIRGKNLSREAFAEVSKSMKQMEKDSASVGNMGARSFGQMAGSLRQFDDVLQLAGGPNLSGLIQGIGQLDAVATGAAGKLGGLAKAGLVASAGMAGVGVGRWIANLTGSDKLIGDLTLKLMGFDVAEQEAAVGADVLARASQNAGREITDMAEALRINEEAARKVIDTNSRMSASATGATVVAGWRKELSDLRSSGVLDDLRKDLASQNFSQKELADRYRVSTGAMSLFTREAGEQRKALDKATTAAGQHADKMKKLGESFRGLDAVKAAMEAMEQIQAEERDGFSISKMTRDRAANLNKVMLDAIDVHRRAGQAIPEEWQRIARETTIASMQGIADITDLIQIMQSLQQIAVQTPALVIPRLAVTNGLPAGAQIGEQLGVPTIPDGPNMFARMFGSSVDFGAAMSQTMLAAIQGGGNPVSAAAGLVGNRVGTDVAASLAKDGPKVFQGALGGVFSAALPVVGSLLGPLTSALWGKLFGSAGRDSVKDFAATFKGGFDGPGGLHDTLLKELGGVVGEDFWKQITQQVGRNDKAGAAAIIEKAKAALADAAKNKPATIEDEIKSAGFVSRAELQRTADTAKRVYEAMRASGAFTAEAVQAAWARANEALIAAGDTNAIAAQKTKDAIAGIDAEIGKLKGELDSFSAALQAEADAPEFDELGNRIYGVLEAQQMARKKQIESEMAALGAQRDAEIEAKKETFDAMLDDASGVDTQIREMFGKPMAIPYYFQGLNAPAGYIGDMLPQHEEGGPIVKFVTLAPGRTASTAAPSVTPPRLVSA